MEEYRDLDLTVDVFTEVLDEEEFRDIEAGIVLQAYLPESHAVFEQLLAWARTRREQGGAPIKVRIVKGANLAMETVEAQIHGWPRRPTAPRPTSTPTTSGWSTPPCARRTPTPCASGSPATTCSTSPGRSRWLPSTRRQRPDRHRDARGHGQRRGAGHHPRRRLGAALRAGHLARRLRLGRRLPGPPPGREHRPGELPARVVQPHRRLAHLRRAGAPLPRGRERAAHRVHGVPPARPAPAGADRARDRGAVRQRDRDRRDPSRGARADRRRAEPALLRLGPPGPGGGCRRRAGRRRRGGLQPQR